MSEHQEQNGTPSTFTDENVRLFLLCRLNEAERVRLEEVLLVNDDLAERVRLAESELADDYVAGTLDAGERDRFEKQFLITDARRQKLRVSMALRDYSAAKKAGTTASTAAGRQRLWRRAFLGVFGFDRHPILATGAAFALLLLFTGAVFLIVSRYRQVDPVIARNEVLPRPEPQTSPQTPATPEPTSDTPEPTPAKIPEKLPTPMDRSPQPVIATAVLLPGTLRGGGDLIRVAVPDGTQAVVRLKLVVESDRKGAFSADLLTAEGQSVLLRTGLKVAYENSEGMVVLDVPARFLKVGDYQLKLSRRQEGAGFEVVGRYYFRALRK